MYQVTFYQYGVQGFDPEDYRTLAQARKAASEFIQSFRHQPELRQQGSIYRENLAYILDPMDYTEACASIRNIY